MLAILSVPVVDNVLGLYYLFPLVRPVLGVVFTCAEMVMGKKEEGGSRCGTRGHLSLVISPCPGYGNRCTHESHNPP